MSGRNTYVKEELCIMQRHLGTFSTAYDGNADDDKDKDVTRMLKILTLNNIMFFFEHLLGKIYSALY